MQNTYTKKYTANLTYVRERDQKHNKPVLVPDHIGDDQQTYDGKEFTAITMDGKKKRVRLNGSAYGLGSSGTGDMIVNPI